MDMFSAGTVDRIHLFFSYDNRVEMKKLFSTWRLSLLRTLFAPLAPNFTSDFQILVPASASNPHREELNGTRPKPCFTECSGGNLEVGFHAALAWPELSANVMFIITTMYVSRRNIHHDPHAPSHARANQQERHAVLYQLFLIAHPFYPGFEPHRSPSFPSAACLS